jgi:hypothetical protein
MPPSLCTTSRGPPQPQTNIFFIFFLLPAMEEQQLSTVASQDAYTSRAIRPENPSEWWRKLVDDDLISLE